jgi:hypothetical protein
VDSTDAFINEPVTVLLRISDFETAEPPIFPEIPNATVSGPQGPMDSSFTLGLNRRKTVSRTRSYTYEVTPQAAGELVIPPVQVKVDGRVLETEPVHLQVRSSDADELISVEISCDRQRLYVGQRIRVIMTIWIKPFVWRNQPLGVDDMTRLFDPRGMNLGPFPANVSHDIRRLDDAQGNSQIYYTYTTSVDYVPTVPGTLSFDDVVIGYQYPTQLARGIFGRLEVQAVRRLRVRPKVQQIEVLPLPTGGRPDNFTGAVGTFGITASAEPTTVRVGDPITLTVQIRGSGDLDTLPPPNLSADPRLTQSFRVPREELAGEVVGSFKRFTQVIRATRADVEEIPAIEYPYFDPDRGMYVVALSAPIPVAVLPAVELSTESLITPSKVSGKAGGGELRALDGLRGDETRESVLLQPVAGVSVRDLALVTAAPPGVFALACVATLYTQSRSPAQRRRQKALRRAQRRLAQAGRLDARTAAVEISAALSGYLADRLDEPPARLIGRAAVDTLAEHHVAAETCTRWAALLEQCELASFGGTDANTAALVTEAQANLRALAQERL